MEQIVPLPEISSMVELNLLLDYSRNDLVVLDFYATWCLPCKLLAPKMQILQAQYPSVKFAKINVDASEDMAIAYGIHAMPTVCFIVNNKVVDEVLGFDEEKVRQALLKHAPKSS